MSSRHVTRRELLATVGGITLVGVAGCSNATEQSFEATPVVLPEEPREELVLAETARDSTTVSREGPSGNVEVTITSESAVYQRGPARGTPTVLEQFASSVNNTPGSGSAINAVASDVGVDEARLPFLDMPKITPDQYSLVIPEGARGSEGVAPEQTLALVPGWQSDADTVTYEGDGQGAFLADGTFFPEPGEYFPMPGDYLPARGESSDGDIRVFMPNVEAWPKDYDIESLPAGTERVDPGVTMESPNTVFAAPGNLLFPEPGDYDPAPDVFDQGFSLQLGGQPFGVGALATPDASVADRSVNPLVGMDTAELLQRDATKQALAQIGLTDSETVEWLAGPNRNPFSVDRRGPVRAPLLGTETELESFGGVVSGEDGQWGVLLTVARVTDGDHVVAASGITRPVATTEGGMTAVGGSGWGMSEEGAARFLTNQGRFVVEVVGALERV